jgi:hypothetical protein
MQTGEGLTLEAWVAEREPLAQGGRWFLAFALWLDAADGPEWRTGWTEVAIHDLLGTGIEVRPRRNSTIHVTVTTANGEPAPGALISVDDARYPPGRFHQFAFTGEDGTVTVSGIEEDRAWLFALPHGLGPDPSPVSKVVRPPQDGSVVLTSTLAGAWSYRRHFLRPPMRGGSFHVDWVRAEKDRLVPLWSTTPWVGPGRGPWCPFYLMSRADAALPESVRLGLRGFSVAEVPTTAEARLVCVKEGDAEETPR